MPSLTTITIEGFRNLSQVALALAPGITVLTGQNGAGKTSILEALYYLAHGRSFRSADLTTLIQTGQPLMRITAQGLTSCTTTIHPEAQPLRLGLERHITGHRLLRYNGEAVKQQLNLTQALPVIWVSSNSQSLFLGGPSMRRALLDWIVFHVEPSFPTLWQQTQRLLKQRNAALKAKATTAVLTAWETEWQLNAVRIDLLRREYLANWLQQLMPLLHDFLDIGEIQIHYYPGWPEEYTLEEALQRTLSRDRALGYTSVGPHRADIRISVQGVAVADRLSQGQLKQLAYAFALSQGQMLMAYTQQAPLFLLDDIPSELDQVHCQRFFTALSQLRAQSIITGIELTDFLTLQQTGHAIQHYQLRHGFLELHVNQGVYI